jgi:hypothetical protein
MRYQPTPSGNEVAFAESEVLALSTTDTEETLVASVAGEFGSCDVWFSGPSDWLAASPAVIVRLYARHGTARLMVGQANLMDAQHTEDRNGVSSAWAFSARGVESNGFEVTCQRTSGGDRLTGGQFFLRAKAGSATPSLLAAGGLAGLRSVTVSNVVQVQPAGPLTVVQSQPSALSATVVQSSSSALQATAAQGAAAAAANRWPVYLSDGTAALGTTTNPFYVGRIRDASPTFAATTGLVGTGGTVAVKSLAYLWRSTSKRIEVSRITVSYLPGPTTGTGLYVVFRATRFTATPTGTPVSAAALDSSDSLGVGIYSATSSPAPSSGDIFAVAVLATASGLYEWRAGSSGKPIVLRAGVSEGIQVIADVKSTLSTQMQATVGFEWVEV